MVCRHILSSRGYYEPRRNQKEINSQIHDHFKLKNMKLTMKLYEIHFIKVRDNMDKITLRVQKIHLNYLSTIINEINKIFITLSKKKQKRDLKHHYKCMKRDLDFY